MVEALKSTYREELSCNKGYGGGRDRWTPLSGALTMPGYNRVEGQINKLSVKQPPCRSIALGTNSTSCNKALNVERENVFELATVLLP